MTFKQMYSYVLGRTNNLSTGQKKLPEVKASLNEAQNWIGSEYPDLLIAEKTLEITEIADDGLYELESDVLQLLTNRVYYDKKIIDFISPVQLEKRNSNWLNEPAGTPKYFTEFTTTSPRKIYLYPKVKSTGKELYYQYHKWAIELTADEDVSDYNVSLHFAIVDYACYLLTGDEKFLVRAKITLDRGIGVMREAIREMPMKVDWNEKSETRKK